MTVEPREYPHHGWEGESVGWRKRDTEKGDLRVCSVPLLLLLAVRRRHLHLLCHHAHCSHTSMSWVHWAGISLLEESSVLLSQKQHGSYADTEGMLYAHSPGKARWNMSLGYFLPLCFTIKVEIRSKNAAAKLLISTLITISTVIWFHFFQVNVYLLYFRREREKNLTEQGHYH